MNTVETILAAHVATISAVSQGGIQVRGGNARRCTCGATIWAYWDELPDDANSTDALLNDRFGQHVARQFVEAGMALFAQRVPLADVLSGHKALHQTPAGCSCGAKSDYLPNWHANHLANVAEEAGYGYGGGGVK